MRNDARSAVCIVLSIIAMGMLIYGTPSMGRLPDTNWAKVAIASVFALLAIAWRPE